MSTSRAVLRLLAIGLVLLSPLVPGCDVQPAGPAAGAPGSAGGRRVIGLTLMTYNNPFFNVLKNAARKAAAEAGCELREHDAADDASKQATAIDGFLTQGVDAILLNPVDSAAVVSSVKEANRHGVPVVCVDVKADGGDLATFVASDNRELGVFVGEYLVKRLGGEGKIAMVTYPTVSSGANRAAGTKSVLEKHPGIQIVAEQSSIGQRLKAMSVTENLLTAHPDLDAIWAINDPSALGCVRAIKQAGREKDIFVVSIDGSPEAVEEIRRGETLVATAAQYPQKIGRVGVEMALRALEGESLDEFVPIRGALITKDTVDSYEGWTD